MGALIIRELNDIDIVIEEKVEFDILRKNEYIEKFKDSVSKGNIRAGTGFYDDKWIFNIGGIEKSIIFPKELEMKKLSDLFNREKKEFEVAYRSFIIFNFRFFSTIKVFNSKMKEIVADIKKVENDSVSKAILLKFISYVTISEEKYEMFLDIFDEIKEREFGERMLPDFEDIFLFSDIVMDIVENHDLLNYKDYLLTIMWWKICSILPLRPSEFLRIKFDCIYKEKNEFYLKVRRSKGKSGRRIKNISLVDEYYYEDIINIDENLFDFIKKYQGILRVNFDYKEDIELFPFILIKNAIYRKNNKNKRKNNLNTITSTDLEINLNRFYKDIIYEKYGVKPISKYVKKESDLNYIQQLTTYDARHIAIINLILLGVDVLEVMYLAGHSNVNTAYGYFNHVKTFSKGYALGYAKSIKSKKLINEYIGVNIRLNKNKGKEDFKRVLDTINEIKFEPKKVDGGYCYYRNIENDKSFCFFYERNHKRCRYFIEETKEVLEDEIKKVEKEIDSCVKVLIDLVKDRDNISKFNELYQVTSYKLSQGIYDLSNLNKKLLVEE